MSKRIAVIGTGYVGLVAAIGLADFGNSVIGVDLDESKVNSLNKAVPTIYERGIEEYLKSNIQSQRLSFTTDIDKAIVDSEVIFIAVGTPPKDDGGADLSQVESVARSVAKNLDGYKVIVTKSTVPIGTNRWIKETVQNIAPGKEFDVVSNPEFLREGKAVHDFFHPDRVVIGCESERAKDVLKDIYRSLNLIQAPFVWCGLETAELIKYASNAFLATKITFINQMANLAESVGADIHLVAKSMGMDGRISPKFLHPGPGYGGSCFPKDTKAVAYTGDAYNTDMSLIKEVIRANEEQKRRMVHKLENLCGDLRGKKVALLGLAFKADTDDIRESPALSIANELQKAGAVVSAHDPKAAENFAKEFPDFRYFENEFEASKEAEVLIICTEWNEYRNLDLPRLKSVMAGNVILDTRNVLDPEFVQQVGFIYEGVGRGLVKNG